MILEPKKIKSVTLSITNGITDSMDMSLSKFREMVKDTKAWRAAVYGGHKESDTTELLNNKSRLYRCHC